MPTQSENSDYIEYACRSCKTVGMKSRTHPVGRLNLQDGNTYFIKLCFNLTKVDRFKNKLLQKIFKGFRWLPVMPDGSFHLGRVYEENFSDRLDSYLSVQYRIKFTEIIPLESEKQLWNLYSKLVQAKALIRESIFSERTRKENNSPSHEFVFELMKNDRGKLIYRDDPGHCCPNCQSADFRYGLAYCPVCDNLLTEERVGHRD